MQFDGFEGVAICFDPSEADLDNCTEVNDTTSAILLQPDDENRRKKRHIGYSSVRHSGISIQA